MLEWIARIANHFTECHSFVAVWTYFIVVYIKYEQSIYICLHSESITRVIAQPKITHMIMTAATTKTPTVPNITINEPIPAIMHRMKINHARAFRNVFFIGHAPELVQHTILLPPIQPEFPIQKVLATGLRSVPMAARQQS
jgi:hypothetical protein